MLQHYLLLFRSVGSGASPSIIAGPFRLAAAQSYLAGASVADAFRAGAYRSGSYVAGDAESDLFLAGQAASNSFTAGVQKGDYA